MRFQTNLPTAPFAREKLFFSDASCNKNTLTIMDKIVIEPATLEDLPRLTDLLVDLFAQEADFKPDRAKQMRGLRLILEEPSRGRIFVLRQNGEILGMINLLFTVSTAEGGFVILLEDLVIHRDHRHHGYGDQLLQHAIQFAREKGFVRITLLADRDHDESLRFFKNHGFVESTMIPMRLLLSTQNTPPEQQPPSSQP